jgi:hypothetical protein
VSHESLVAALEEADFRDPVVLDALELHGDELLPILLAHASPEARAAALRGLLGERLDCDGVMDALSDAHENGFPSKHWVRNILAPTPPTGGTAE